GDFATLAISDEPVVGIASVVTLLDDAHIVIDRIGVLQGLAGAHELGLAVGVPAFELADGGFGDHDAGRIDAKVVVAGNHSGKAIHQDAIAVRWNDVEHHDPARTGQVTGPVVVCDHDLVVFGHAAGGNESAAIAGSNQFGRVHRLFTLVQPGEVVVGNFLEGVERDDVIHVEVGSVRFGSVRDPLQ